MWCVFTFCERQFERNLAGKAVSLQDEKKRVEEISALRQAKNIYKYAIAHDNSVNDTTIGTMLQCMRRSI